MNIATQNWWCRSLQWFCDGGSSRSGELAPEIDAVALTGACCLVIAAILYVAGRPRRP